MLNRRVILLLATVQFGHTSDNIDEKRLCKDQNLTLSFGQTVQFRRAVVTTDPFPAREKTTCTLRVKVNAAATILLTLTTVNIWKSFTSSNNAQGYELLHDAGESKLVYNNNLLDGSSAWTNASVEPCPYLFVWRASAANSSDTVKSNFNQSKTLNAAGVVIQLRNVPDWAWCDIRIEINASPMPEHYCRAKDELYCNTSVQCLNASLRCNSNQDCDNGEDEMNCSKDGLTEGMFTVETAVSLSVAIGIVILMTAAIAVVLRRRRLERLRNTDDSCNYSSNHRGESSLPESATSPCLIDNNMYSPSPDCPRLLNANPAEPIYFELEPQCGQTATSLV